MLGCPQGVFGGCDRKGPALKCLLNYLYPDLEVLLEMTTEHSDTMEEELHNRAQEALRESERRLRLIVEATPVPVVISRMVDGRIVYANAMAGPLVGLGTEELLGRQITDFYRDPADQDRLLGALTEGGQVDHYQVRFQTADGAQLWVDVSMRTLEFNDEPRLLSTWHNIYGRNAGYPAPPVQTRTCSFPASGSSVVLASAVQSRAIKQTLSDV
jgi:PAS domain S-box-containing protein